MPAAVKEFIESLAGLRADGKRLGFLVHSGFMEAVHSRAVERYLAKLAGRLGAGYLGTIVKGGSEGLHLKPPAATKKVRGRLRELGRIFGATAGFDEGIIAALAKPEKFSGPMRLVARAMAAIGLVNFYWDGMLKRNGAYERRFATPYVE